MSKPASKLQTGRIDGVVLGVTQRPFQELARWLRLVGMGLGIGIVVPFMPQMTWAGWFLASAFAAFLAQLPGLGVEWMKTSFQVEVTPGELKVTGRSGLWFPRLVRLSFRVGEVKVVRVRETGFPNWRVGGLAVRSDGREWVFCGVGDPDVTRARIQEALAQAERDVAGRLGAPTDIPSELERLQATRGLTPDSRE